MSRHIALGFFDGVHRGHGELLKVTVNAAAKHGGKACALTFDTHPEREITGYQPPLLSTVANRSEMMRRLYGIDEIIILPFDETLMRTRWDAFIRDILIGRFEAAHVVVGHDFHFGYKGQGNAERLKTECCMLGIQCDIVPKVEIDGITISSTYIRGLIAQGDMERAELFLGHPHVLYGRVVQGQRLGVKLGFPTANIDLKDGIIVPARGVYTSRLTIEGEDVPRPAITHIGTRPSVEPDGCVKAETLILDYDGQLYGKNVRIELLTFLREERFFPDLEELRRQMREDEDRARAFHRCGSKENTGIS